MLHAGVRQKYIPGRQDRRNIQLHEGQTIKILSRTTLKL